VTPPSVAERNALKTDCPNCGARLGDWCTEDDKRRPILHKSRAIAARKRSAALRRNVRKLFF
jgi:hypothetical protein